jgi:hypothetical protein
VPLQDEVRKNFIWLLPIIEKYPQCALPPYLIADLFHYLNLRLSLALLWEGILNFLRIGI